MQVVPILATMQYFICMLQIIFFQEEFILTFRVRIRSRNRLRDWDFRDLK